MGPFYDFDEFHHQGRIKEVYVDHLGRPVGGIGDQGADDRRTIGGQNGMRGGQSVKICKDLSLGVENLDGCFDDKVGVFGRFL